MRRHLASRLGLLLLAAALLCPAVVSAAEVKAQVPVETFKLDNGMTFLLVQKPELATVSGGWVAHVGSANEHPGITGLTHLFEHMMFKGTRTIGTTNIKRDLEIIEEQEKLQEQIRGIYAAQRDRWRRGEIDDPYADANRTPELVALQEKFQKLVDEQRSLMVKDEFDKVYSGAGGSQMNAFTNQDMTVYFITVPTNKLELWFWMESDRLANLVLREFYSERDVVHEERRLRTESTPTGKYDEQLESMFWGAHPYKWPIVGWPSDLRVISKAQAEDYYNTYYSPNNITAALVGKFDPAEVKALAQKYFGRIPRGRVAPPSVVTMEMPQIAAKEMTATCDCQPQVEVLYHSVPFRHKDSYALDVLGGLLSGRTGRLTKALVLDKKIATSAFAFQNSMKWAGSFGFGAEVKGDAKPEELAAAWNAEVKKLIDEPIPAEELQKVKNQITGNAYRRLVNPFGLLVQLLRYDGLGDWTYINDWSEKTLAVTADDVKRVAKAYITPDNSTTAFYYRKAGAVAEDLPPEIAGASDDVKPMLVQQYKQMRQQLAQATDVAKLQASLARLQGVKNSDQAPPAFKKAIPVFEKMINDRIAELQKNAPAAQGGK